MSDQPPYDRPDQGGPPHQGAQDQPPYQGQGGGDAPPAGAGWPPPGQAPCGDAYGQPYGAPPKNGMGTAALVVGIIGLVLSVLFFPLGILLGIVAAVLGFLGRKKAARREATNGGQATAGMVLGLVAVLVGGLIAAVFGSLIASNSDEFADLSDCLADATTETEQSACREEFEGELGG